MDAHNAVVEALYKTLTQTNSRQDLVSALRRWVDFLDVPNAPRGEEQVSEQVSEQVPSMDDTPPKERTLPATGITSKEAAEILHCRYGMLGACSRKGWLKKIPSPKGQTWYDRAVFEENLEAMRDHIIEKLARKTGRGDGYLSLEE